MVYMLDHTLGYSVAVGAFCLGARVIEKHVVLDKNDNTVDAGFSMTPDEFHSMICSIKYKSLISKDDIL